jgi:hypothetical protein
MNYNVSKNIKSEVSGINFMDVGIHENVELKKVVYDVSDKGSEFLAFYFEDEKGKTLVHTEYKPSSDDPEVLANKTLNQMKRVKHIAVKYVTEDEFTFDVATFKDFAEKTIKVLGTSFLNKKCRVKVIYSWNNYTSLPKYVPFIESMEIPTEKSGLEISSIDKMTKDRPDTRFQKVDNPFEVENNVETVNSEPQPTVDGGLPF